MPGVRGAKRTLMVDIEPKPGAVGPHLRLHPAYSGDGMLVAENIEEVQP